MLSIKGQKQLTEAVRELSEKLSTIDPIDEDFTQHISEYLMLAAFIGKEEGVKEGKSRMRHQLRTANRHLRQCEKTLREIYASWNLQWYNRENGSASETAVPTPPESIVIPALPDLPPPDSSIPLGDELPKD